MTEFKMAMALAAHTWPGTSMAEGAQHILAQVYSPHAHVGDQEKCTRCGQEKSGPLHSQQ
jgi:hypothetical protein